MAISSMIEWTDATWNPVTGCLMVSPGCTNCYAMRMASRLAAMRQPAYQGLTRKSGGRPVWTGRIELVEKMLSIPFGWRKPRRVFVNSMSDLFQEAVPAPFIRRVWAVMEEASWHTFQILTKRPERMRSILVNEHLPTLPNVWLGTSVESRDYVSRIADLRDTPASTRFVSFEPLLGPVGKANLRDIDWAIVGGESGPGARPMDERWVSEIQERCSRFGTAFFFKQWGGVNKKKTGRVFKGRTWNEYPAALSAAAE